MKFISIFVAHPCYEARIMCCRNWSSAPLSRLWMFNLIKQGMVRKYSKQESVFDCMVYSVDGKTPLCSFTADFRIRLSFSSVNYGTNAWTLMAELQRFISRLQRYLFDTKQFKISDGRLYGQEDFLFTDEMFLDDNYLA